jgi:hypothetical protein
MPPSGTGDDDLDDWEALVDRALPPGTAEARLKGQREIIIRQGRIIADLARMLQEERKEKT